MQHVFLHIPRTGGTSFRAVMDKIWGPCVRVGPEFNNRLQDVPRDAEAYYGHSHYGLHEYLPQPVQYWTLLRAPDVRLRSAARNAGCTVEELLTKAPEQSNMMVRMLAGSLPGAPYDARPMTREHLSVACARLKALAFGFTTDIPSFCRRYRLLAAMRREGVTWPRLNASVDACVGSVPAWAVELDYELYDAATMRWSTEETW